MSLIFYGFTIDSVKQICTNITRFILNLENAIALLFDTIFLSIHKFYIRENKSLFVNVTQVFHTFHFFNDKNIYNLDFY